MTETETQTLALRVYETLAPVVLANLEHYQDDFKVHDRQLIEATAVPGMEYLVAVRQTGTQLFPLGLPVSDGSTYLASSAQAFFLCRATTQPSVRTLSASQAQERLRRESRFQIRQSGGGGDWLLRLQAGTADVGSARVRVACMHGVGTKADMEVSLRPGLNALDQMLAELAVEQHVNSLTGTLFWSFSRLKINGLERSEWLASLRESAMALAWA